MPADEQHGLRSRWARPQEFSGGSVSGAGRWYAGGRPLADGLELLDPARRVLLGAHGRVVDGLVDVRLAPTEQDEDEPNHLVGHRHDGFFVRLAHRQAAVLGRQRALGHARGVGAFAKDEADGASGE